MEDRYLLLKCPKCGGKIIFSTNQQIATCDDCGSLITLPRVMYNDSLSVEKRTAIIEKFNKATDFQLDFQFHRAYNIYNKIIKANENNNFEDYYPYWCKVLAQYGILYELNDYLEPKVVPNRTSFESIFNNPNYLKALELASLNIQTILKQEATKIDSAIKKIQYGIFDYAPKNVCIYIDDSDNNPKKERDLRILEDVKRTLKARVLTYQTSEGMINLLNKELMETKLFGLINNSQMMIVISSAFNHFMANYFRNTWSRFNHKYQKTETADNRLIVLTDIDVAGIDEKGLGVKKDQIVSLRNPRHLAILNALIDANIKKIKLSDEKEYRAEEKYLEINESIQNEKYDEAKAALNILIEEGCSSSIIWFYSYLVRNKIKGIELDNKKLIDPRLDYFFNKAYQTAPFLEKIKLYDYINTCLDRLTILDEVDENYEKELLKAQKEMHAKRKLLLIRDFSLIFILNILSFATLSLGNIAMIIIAVLLFGSFYAYAIRRYIMSISIEKIPDGLRNKVDVKKYFYRIKKELTPEQAARFIPGPYAKKTKLFANVVLIIAVAFTFSFFIKELSVKIQNSDLNYYYVFNRVVITGGNDKDIVIPSRIGLRNVYKIANKAFYKNDKLETLEFKYGTIIIGDDAFAKCYNLQSITLPASLRRVGGRGKESFRDCNNVKKIQYSKISGIRMEDLFGDDWIEKMDQLQTS